MSIETFKSHDIIFNAIGGMKMTIGERLKAVRNDHDLNQEQVAKIIGCSRKQIIRYEHDEQKMTIENLIKQPNSTKHYFRSHTLHTFHKVFHSPSETEPNYKSLRILPSS